MCNRCEELEEQVAFLRRELGINRDLAEVSKLIGLGLGASEARIIMALRAAKGPVNYARLELALADSGAYENIANLIKAYVWRIRHKLGFDVIENVFGIGYRLTARGYEVTA